MSEDWLKSLPPGIYWGPRGVVLLQPNPQPTTARSVRQLKIRVLYAWNTLTASHHGRLTGASLREVQELCVLCRKVLDSCGLRYPSQVATGG